MGKNEFPEWAKLYEYDSTIEDNQDNFHADIAAKYGPLFEAALDVSKDLHGRELPVQAEHKRKLRAALAALGVQHD